MPFDLRAQLSRLKGRGPALVLMHDNPDPDSMAAAECMRTLLRTAAGLPVTVARGGIVGRPENRAMVTELRLEHVHIEGIRFDHYRVIALVDTQPGTGNNALPPGHHVDIVVDHHPPRPGVERVAWCDVREEVGASSTIAYRYLTEPGWETYARANVAVQAGPMIAPPPVVLRERYLVINDHDEATTSRNVTLTLGASDCLQMQVSNTADMAGALSTNGVQVQAEARSRERRISGAPPGRRRRHAH